jgi:uncharacterized protein Yka (UPF0111/DUF47 family)
MVRSILNKILPPEEKIFYTYFEESSKICRETAELFYNILHNNVQDDALVDARRLKHESNYITKQTLIKLNGTFITPIDREDIQRLITVLNKITKKIVKTCFNLKVYRIHEYNKSMLKQSETLLEAADELIIIVRLIKDISKIREITECNQRMKEIETTGDEIHNTAMDKLFSGEYDSLTVIKMRDIYKDIESALDACFTVSDTILNVVLKHG